MAKQKCPKADIRTEWKHGPAERPHTCPYDDDVNSEEYEGREEEKPLCECCENCTQECANDI